MGVLKRRRESPDASAQPAARKYRTPRTPLVYFALFALVSVVVGVKGVFFLLGDIRAVVSSVPDDTAYFYKIAWHVATGKGLTFDGINQTNGFQPLWLYALVPLAWVMRDASPEAYFRAALLYQMLYVIAAGVLLFYAVAMMTNRRIALFAAAVFFLFACHAIVFLNGMETGVLLLCLSLIVVYSFRYRVFEQANAYAALRFGMLLGLVFLARLDMVYFLVVLYTVLFGCALLLGWRGEQAASLWRDIAMSLWGLAVVVSPYLIYNQVAFGAIMPISGRLKNTFPYIVQPVFGPPRFSVRDLLVIASVAMFACWAVYELWRGKGASPPRYYWITVALGAGSVIAHYLHAALFMKWAVFAWHFAFYYFVLCLVMAAALPRFVQRLGVWSNFATSLCAFGTTVAVIGYLILRANEQYTLTGWQTIAYDAAVWTRQNSAPNAVFAMKDAGIFGLFSQRAVINLDGLVNNMEYQEALRRQQLNRYLAERGVDYLVQHAFWTNPSQNRAVLSGDYEYLEIPYRSQLYGNLSEPVRVYRSDESFRKKYFDPWHRVDTVFLIWRLRLK